MIILHQNYLHEIHYDMIHNYHTHYFLDFHFQSGNPLMSTWVLTCLCLHVQYLTFQLDYRQFLIYLTCLLPVCYTWYLWPYTLDSSDIDRSYDECSTFLSSIFIHCFLYYNNVTHFLPHLMALDILLVSFDTRILLFHILLITSMIRCGHQHHW